ncbi:MAG: hypothetical protein M0022_08255 [Desulfobacteraceae bacterium]|nr:hypothetical protein [Desulfobacteraceae bacterium]
MKKAISFAMAVLFALSLTSVAMAAGTAKKKAEKKMHVKKAARTMRIFGAVSAVDTTANTITVKRKKGEVTLTVTPKTVIKFAARKKITLDKVKAGERIFARYIKSKGANDATYISVRPALKKATKAKKTAKKAKKAEKKK